MKDKELQDNKLQLLLSGIDKPIADDGFTQLVMQELPEKSAWRWEKHLLVVCYLAACILVAVFFPMSILLNVFSNISSSPLPFIALAMGLAGASWFVAADFAD